MMTHGLELGYHPSSDLLSSEKVVPRLSVTGPD